MRDSPVQTHRLRDFNAYTNYEAAEPLYRRAASASEKGESTGAPRYRPLSQ